MEKDNRGTLQRMLDAQIEEIDNISILSMPTMKVLFLPYSIAGKQIPFQEYLNKCDAILFLVGIYPSTQGLRDVYINNDINLLASRPTLVEYHAIIQNISWYFIG